ncbi:MAG: putative glycoside hydrolase, partial [Gemmatimonadota bacterium]|nr:putative glycoside hydrolase [Gemmatimonadota bacterium]
PNTMPYETVFKSAGMARLRNDRLQEAGVRPARVIPWLQAFSAPWVNKNYTYGAEQARAQIKGTYDAGFDDWIFWHPGSKYELVAAAFEPTMESRRTAAYVPPPEVLRTVDLFEAQGVKEARDRAAEQARGQTTDPQAAQAAKTGEPKTPAPPAGGG